LCGCPPGGVAPGSDAGAPCPPSKLTSEQQAEQIGQVMQSRLDVIRPCFDAAAKDGGSGGKIVFRLQIAPDGSLFRVRTSYVSLPIPSVQTCAIRAVESLRFPPPAGGHVTVSYPMIFSVRDE
ncbi:MAG: AgmX/PglI C-terminal domain-containing protein, partial [Deltaproteobacteria bacterium]|nr:AgmX/PglI C-terminal domain-containing protein [Deltaproteobacteria bacterium]MBW2535169.1 AgmX/PglI C-terminal domain-containing protein [Deltaproteobacteria bacterium]